MKIRVTIPPPIFTVEIETEQCREFFVQHCPQDRYGDTLSIGRVYCGDVLLFERWFHDNEGYGYGSDPIEWGGKQVHFCPFNEDEMIEETLKAFGLLLKEKLWL